MIWQHAGRTPDVHSVGVRWYSSLEISAARLIYAKLRIYLAVAISIL